MTGMTGSQKLDDRLQAILTDLYEVEEKKVEGGRLPYELWSRVIDRLEVITERNKDELNGQPAVAAGVKCSCGSGVFCPAHGRRK